MYTRLLSTLPPASRKLLPALSLAPRIEGQLSCTCLGMAHSGFSNVLKNGGFQAFLWTQFLGAFNDSVYQTIVALHVGNANPAYVPLVPAVFTLPSLLFSGYSGHLADLVSKRRVLVGVKLFEIAIMLFGPAGWPAPGGAFSGGGEGRPLGPSARPPPPPPPGVCPPACKSRAPGLP